MLQVQKKPEEQHKVIVLNYPFTLSTLHLSPHLLSGDPFHFHFSLQLICLTLALFNGLLKLNPPRTGEERQETLWHNQAAQIV